MDKMQDLLILEPNHLLILLLTILTFSYHRKYHKYK